MSSGTVSATSTYSPGTGASFAKDIGSRVLAAAQAAKDEKKIQEKIEKEGGTVPEAAKKNLFGKALKQQFVGNPINKIKGKANKAIGKTANFVGFFGSKGRKLEDKILGKKFKIKKAGFDRSGYKKGGSEDDDDNSGGAGGGGSPLTSSLGSLVLDIQAIASQVSLMQGLVATQMNITGKMADSLDEIKNVLGEQVSLQQQRISAEERAAAEASLESSQQVSGTSAATSTFTDGNPLAGLLGIFGQIQNLFGMLKNLPELFKGMFKGLLEKLPFGKGLAGKLFGGAAKEAGGEAAEVGIKSIFGKMLRPIFKRIPIIGGLIDFAISLALGEPIGRAAAKAVGSMLGAGLGTLIPIPGVGTIAGGILGDWVGGTVYDMISSAFAPKKLAGGGVMVGEAGKEMVTGLNTAPAKQHLGGASNEDPAGSYFSAIAGTTLAVTKDFVEGLGPIGAAVAPAIQDDISKLGKVFELPATSIKMSVGGLGLNPVTNAAKKGEKFLESLVKGTLEKITGKKDKDKKKNKNGDSGGGDSGNGNNNPPANTNQPTGGGKNDLTFGDSIASGLAGRQGANQQTIVDSKGVSKVGASPADVLGQLQSFDKTKLKGKVVRLSSGITNNPSDLKNVEEQIKYLVSVGAKVQLVGVTNTPPKNGTQYGHLEKSLSGMNDKLSAIASKYSDKGVTFLGGFTPGADGIHPANASQLNSSYSVDVLPGGKVGAESGAKIDLWATSSAGNTKLSSSSTFKDTRVHGHRPGPSARGWPRDYAVVKPGVDPVANPKAGKGEPVVAGVSGKVTVSENWGGNAGNTVQIADNSGKTIATFHHFDQLRTKVGASVSPNTVIGTQGNTGTRDIHVHLEAAEKVHSNWIASMLGGTYTDTTDDTNSDGDGNEDTMSSEDPFEALEQGLKGMFTAAGAMVGAKNQEEYDANKAALESLSPTTSNNITRTGNVTTPATPPANNGQTPTNPTNPVASNPAAVPVTSGSSTPGSMARSTAPSNTPGHYAPLSS